MKTRDLSVLVSELRTWIDDNRGLCHQLVHRLQTGGRTFLLHSDLQDAFRTLSTQAEAKALLNSPFAYLIRHTQEAAQDAAWIYLSVRSRVADWGYVRIHVETLDLQQAEATDFLRFKEHLADGIREDDWVLEIDLGPFSREFPKLQESDSIGRGVQFLNRHLSSRLFKDLAEGTAQVLNFLRLHCYRDQALMLDAKVETVGQLREALRRADRYLATLPPETPWPQLYAELNGLGFLPGWGKDAGRVLDTMRLLRDILEAPSPDNLERFLGRVPMIFAVAILSPHGFFGQHGVLGRPDTGGQVVYILDQVRALEKEMVERLRIQGLDIEPRVVVITRLIPEAEGTTCNQALEPIAGTRNAEILRVPFRTEGGGIVQHWITRFEVWPYLERFSVDVERELLAHLGGGPDLIVGNYSDGNLVATLLAQRLQVTQCTIAHALEKTKYLYSDLYWRENEPHYHFSCQFTADLIAMNTADFIIASTYQEIAGTTESPGQYESYGSFTMPGLYRVVDGIDVYDPKFNIVSPGADAEVYFPYDQTERRLKHLTEDIDALLFGPPGDDRRGQLQRPELPILFTMARLDRIKNVTGLVEWYAGNEELRQNANLVVIGGHTNPDRSGDTEERDQILRMHALMDEHGLDGQLRWLGVHLERGLAGELYRVVADKRGAFIQPAIFEAFGLTVIEAMGSGLPTFATIFGGPAEIIVDGKSGFHIDPNHGARAAKRIADFLACCRDDPDHWFTLSRGALARVEERYTWRLYAERMMTLARVYGFWRYVTNLDRAETRRYLEMLYGLQYRPRAATVDTGQHG
ncbi:MAG: sucrose synthase [Chromatiales bacterium]|nr:sucrose synthase [Chromatiales bacterium]